MVKQARVSVKNKSLTGRISIKGSKSISNRCLIMAALSGEKSKLENLSDSDDTTRLSRYLKMVNTCASSRIPLVIDTGNAGTVMRFMAAYLSQKEGKWLLTGSERMKQRPIGELVDSLKKLGAKIKFAGQPGFPPLIITGTNLKSKTLDVDVSQSSQFVSALMMIGPYLSGGLKLNFSTSPVSFSYIEMTAKLMESFGAGVEITRESVKVEGGTYRLNDSLVEADWSSASYWYEMAVFAETADVFLEGYKKKSIQGDSVLTEIYQQLGVKTSFEKKGIRLTKSKQLTNLLEFDCSSCPDLVPAILTTCAAIGVRASLSGVGHLKFKESDRLEVFKIELAKIGAEITVSENKVVLVPGKFDPNMEIEFDTYKDHRVAMSLAPLAFKLKSVLINDPGVVEKSYPGFWDDLRQTNSFTVDKI
jgi:3-phosphoshikimate 1-carboxyvinyltransferase